MIPIIYAGQEVFMQFRIVSAAAIICLFLSIAFSSGFTVSESPRNMGRKVNSTANDFAPAISPDGSYMIFNSNRNGKYQDLFISYYRNGTWSTPEPLDILNSPYNDETPFITADGRYLLFASDRDGSMEMRDENNQVKVSFDIYFSENIDGKWTVPEPVPGEINTVHHERTPSLTSEGKLYYATWLFGDSSRTLLIEAENVDGNFVNPRPMKGPFNTGFPDVGLIPAEDLNGFFFASVRPDSFGLYDLYFVSYKNGVYGTPVNLGEKINSEANEMYLTRADQRYFISSNRDGGVGQFDLYSAFIFTKEADFETRAIHFDYDRSVIKKESYPYLDALAVFLRDNSDVRLEIVGHTDLHGSDEHNNRLSLERAEAVKKYLTGKGLNPERFKTSGAGKTSPVVRRKGKGYDELNRRTEFRIIRDK